MQDEPNNVFGYPARPHHAIGSRRVGGRSPADAMLGRAGAEVDRPNPRPAVDAFGADRVAERQHARFQCRALGKGGGDQRHPGAGGFDANAARGTRDGRVDDAVAPDDAFARRRRRAGQRA